MTKRALSLLLTLVMVLSLCVPALAADEFEAETAAVAEEEQAPVAPVEPEALEETEEVEAEEAAQYPGSSSGADTATAADYANLHSILDANREKYTQAKNGQRVGATYFFSEWLADDEDTEVKDFIKAFEDGEKYYADYENGAYPLPDHEWITSLAGAIGARGNATYGPTLNNQSSFITNSTPGGFGNLLQNLTQMVGTESAKETCSKRVHADWLKALEDLYWDMYFIEEDAKANGGQYPVDKVLEVLTRARKGDDDFWDAIQGWDHSYASSGLDSSLAGKLGKAVQANAEDSADLKEAYDALDAAIKGASRVYKSNEPGKTVVKNAEDLRDGIKSAVFDALTGNGLKSYVTYNDVLGLIDACEYYVDTIVSNKQNAKFISWRVDPTLNELIIFVDLTKNYDDAAWYDEYILQVSMGTAKPKTFEFYKDGGQTPGVEPGIGEVGRFYAVVHKNELLTTDGAQFVPDQDVLTAKLMDKDGNVYDTMPIEISKDTSPQIVGSGFKTTATCNGVELTDAFYLTFNGNLSYFESYYTGSRIEVTKPDGKSYKRALEGTLFDKANNAYWIDNDIQVGTYSISYYVTDNTALTGSKEIGPKTTTITVNDITKYVSTSDKVLDYADLLEAISDAANYQQMVVNAKGKAAGLTTASAQAAVARNLSAANALVAAAATTPDTSKNEQKVQDVTKKLNDAMKYLTTGADQSDLDAAIAEAKALVESDYTPVTWTALQTVVKAGEKVKKEAITTSIADAKKIADAAKDIRKAISDLVVLKPDLTGLKALVDSVPYRLSADNYTAESKAAVNAAAAAAQAVLTKTKATRSEVAKAMADLQAALNALTVIPAGDPSGVQPPKGGTGWVFDPTTGDDYYFIDGVMKKDYWVGDHDGASKWNFWYYLGADGKLVKGFHYITNPNGTGWYMLQADNKNGCRGVMLSGWQYTNTAAGTGYFTETRGTNYGKCTRTNVWGAYSAATGLWGDGLSHR